MTVWTDDLADINTAVRVLVERDPEPAVDLILNPGAETDTSGWNGVNGLLTRNTTEHRTGSASFRVQGSGSAARLSSDPIAVKPGRVYDLSGWIEIKGTAMNLRASITWRDVSGSTISTTNGTSSAGVVDTWRHYTLDGVVAPDDAAAAVVSFGQVAGVADAFYVDDISLTERAELVNSCPNPSGELGAWGWITERVFTQGMQLLTSSGGYLVWSNVGDPGGGLDDELVGSPQTELILIEPSQWVAAVWTDGPSDCYSRIRFNWFDATGVLLSSSTQSAAMSPAGSDTARSYAAQQAPSDTQYVSAEWTLTSDASFGFTHNGDTHRLKDVTIAIADSSGELTGLGTGLPAYYELDLTDSLGTLGTHREALDLGTLSMQLTGDSLDSAINPLLRPAKRIRVQGLSDESWETIWQGAITRVGVDYDLTQSVGRRAIITVTALDGLKRLDALAPDGSETVEALPWVLAGHGVPWSCNGSGDQVATTILGLPVPGVVTEADAGATVLDQVLRSRDTTLGAAWLDRHGVLQVYDDDNLPDVPVATLTDDDYIVPGTALNYDTDACVNYITVTQQTGLGDSETTGPYYDAVSLAKGKRTATYTIIGSGDPVAFATAVLAANAIPAVVLASVQIPVRDVDDVTAWCLLELMDLVTVTHDDPAIDADYRITAIDHTVSSAGWWITLTLGANGRRSLPTVRIT